MTNQDRNIRLAELLGYEAIHKHEYQSTVQVRAHDRHDGRPFNFDPCETWGDIMPLVVEHNIVYTRDIDMTTFAAYLYSPTSNSFDSHQWHFSPNTDLRIALLDCLISVLEAKKFNPTNR